MKLSTILNSVFLAMLAFTAQAAEYGNFNDSCTDPQIEVGCRTNTITGFCMAKDSDTERCRADSGIGPRTTPSESPPRITNK